MDIFVIGMGILIIIFFIRYERYEQNQIKIRQEQKQQQYLKEQQEKKKRQEEAEAREKAKLQAFYNDCKKRNIDTNNDQRSLLRIAEYHGIHDIDKAIEVYNKGKAAVIQDIRDIELKEYEEQHSKVKLYGKKKYTAELLVLLEQYTKDAQKNELISKTFVTLKPTERNAEVGGLLGAGLTGSPLVGAYVYEKTKQANAASEEAYQNALKSAESASSTFRAKQYKAETMISNIQSALDSFEKDHGICDEHNTKEKFELLQIDKPSMTLTKGGNIRLTTKARLLDVPKLGSSEMILDGCLEFDIWDRTGCRVAVGYFTTKFTIYLGDFIRNVNDKEHFYINAWGFGTHKGCETEINVLCSGNNMIESLDGLSCKIEPLRMWAM